MYEDRFGSYSIAPTLAGRASLRRFEAILRYSRLAPPPRWRDVLRPRELRPPDFLRPSTSDFSGLSLVTSAKSEYVAKRRPGLVGLGLRSGIRRCPPVRRRSGSRRPAPPGRSPSSTGGCARRSARAA